MRDTLLARLLIVLAALFAGLALAGATLGAALGPLAFGLASAASLLPLILPSTIVSFYWANRLRLLPRTLTPEEWRSRLGHAAIIALSAFPYLFGLGYAQEGHLASAFIAFSLFAATQALSISLIWRSNIARERRVAPLPAPEPPPFRGLKATRTILLASLSAALALAAAFFLLRDSLAPASILLIASLVCSAITYRSFKSTIVKSDRVA